MTGTSRSGRPAIYGIVAAAEVERLRPLTNLTGAAAASEVQVGGHWWDELCLLCA